MLINLLVAPVKNPPVATNTTKPRSLATFLSFVSLFFGVQLGFHCRHWLIYSSPWVIYWRPWVSYWTPWVIYWRPWVSYWTPWVIYSRPWVGYWTPWVIYSRPWVSYWTPWMTHWERFLAYFTHSDDKSFILLNNSSFLSL